MPNDPPEKSNKQQHTQGINRRDAIAALIGGGVGALGTNYAASGKDKVKSPDEIKQIYYDLYSNVSKQIPAFQVLQQYIEDNNVGLAIKPEKGSETSVGPIKNLLGFLTCVAGIQDYHEKKDWDRAMGLCNLQIANNNYMGTMLDKLQKAGAFNAFKTAKMFPAKEEDMVPGVLFGQNGPINDWLMQLRVALQKRQALSEPANSQMSVSR